ncbi:MAG: hypothetical protein ACRYG7_44045 [Janthinobacterium lividum]
MPRPPATLTLAEQVVEAELAYYRQLEHYVITAVDFAAWQRNQEQVASELGVPEDSSFYAFARQVLARQYGFLPAYLAQQVSAEAWAYWFLQGGIVVPFR